MTIDIIVSDCREALKAMSDESVNCIVTSPPYWGLRDYGVDGQLGLEQSLHEHIKIMVEVFEECRRVLRKDGTCWINYGDCYASTPNGRSAADTKAVGNDDRTFRDKPFSTIGGVLKPKDLCMIPNRLAIALQEAGWWIRSEIIWGKPNAMPDSSGVTRPSSAHEKVFLLTKSDEVSLWRARDTGELSTSPDLTETCVYVSNGKTGLRWIGQSYYFDAQAVRIPCSTVDDPKQPDSWDTGDGAHGAFHRGGREKGKRKTDKQRGHVRRHNGFNDRWDHMTREEQRQHGRLLRNYEPAPVDVWEIPVFGYNEAHFATFPPELAERCIKAGCPESGTVLDPFGGAGTTGLVADRLRRNAILIELNPEYAAMAERRIHSDAGMFADIARATPTGEAA